MHGGSTVSITLGSKVSRHLVTGRDCISSQSPSVGACLRGPKHRLPHEVSAPTKTLFRSKLCRGGQTSLLCRSKHYSLPQTAKYCIHGIQKVHYLPQTRRSNRKGGELKKRKIRSWRCLFLRNHEAEHTNLQGQRMSRPPAIQELRPYTSALALSRACQDTSLPTNDSLQPREAR